MVKEQDTIEKGNILVSGSLPITGDDGTVLHYDYVKADADIQIKHQVKMKEELPLVVAEHSYSGNSRQSYFFLFGEKQFGGKGKIKYETYDIYQEQQKLQVISDLFVPTFYGRKVVREYHMVNREYSTQEIKEIFGRKLTKKLETLEEKGVQIIEKNVTIKKCEKLWRMEGTLTLIERTGVETKIRQDNEHGRDNEDTGYAN